MSLKITNGYVCAHKNPFQLLSDFRSELTPVWEEVTAAAYVSTAVRYVDRLLYGDPGSKKYASGLLDTGYVERAGWQIDSLTYQNAVSYTLRLFEDKGDAGADFTYERSVVAPELVIGQVPGTGKILALYYGDEKVRKHLKSLGLTKYYYYNNVDKPDDVSAQEWQAREKEWEDAFYGMRGPVSSLGLKMQFVGEYEQSAYYARNLVKKMEVVAVPTVEKRASMLADDKAGNEYADALIDPKDFSMSDFVKYIDKHKDDYFKEIAAQLTELDFARDIQPYI